MRPFADARARLLKFARKSYRDGFMQTQVRGGMAFQIRALRDKFGLSQSEFAEKTHKKQSVISRLENTEYGKASVQTLLDIASANDVALLVKFVSYPVFLDQMEDMSPRALQPETIFESLERDTSKETFSSYINFPEFANRNVEQSQNHLPADGMYREIGRRNDTHPRLQPFPQSQKYGAASTVHEVN